MLCCRISTEPSGALSFHGNSSSANNEDQHSLGVYGNTKSNTRFTLLLRLGSEVRHGWGRKGRREWSRDEWKTGGLPQKYNVLKMFYNYLYIIIIINIIILNSIITRHIVTTTVPTLVGAGGLYAVALLGVVVVVRKM